MCVAFIRIGGKSTFLVLQITTGLLINSLRLFASCIYLPLLCILLYLFLIPRQLYQIFQSSCQDLVYSVTWWRSRLQPSNQYTPQWILLFLKLESSWSPKNVSSSLACTMFVKKVLIVSKEGWRSAADEACSVTFLISWRYCKTPSRTSWPLMSSSYVCGDLRSISISNFNNRQRIILINNFWKFCFEYAMKQWLLSIITIFCRIHLLFDYYLQRMHTLFNETI